MIVSVAWFSLLSFFSFLFFTCIYVLRHVVAASLCPSPWILTVFFTSLTQISVINNLTRSHSSFRMAAKRNIHNPHLSIIPQCNNGMTLAPCKPRCQSSKPQETQHRTHYTSHSRLDQAGLLFACMIVALCL